ncbi:MAG: PAS domain S-box protein [Deltaproteobacteria bacterium]|nr:PAS domain S-box protein [Deltaproteobacteria bacterium]
MTIKAFNSRLLLGHKVFILIYSIVILTIGFTTAAVMWLLHIQNNRFDHHQVTKGIWVVRQCLDGLKENLLKTAVGFTKDRIRMNGLQDLMNIKKNALNQSAHRTMADDLKKNLGEALHNFAVREDIYELYLVGHDLDLLAYTQYQPGGISVIKYPSLTENGNPIRLTTRFKLGGKSQRGWTEEKVKTPDTVPTGLVAPALLGTVRYSKTDHGLALVGQVAFDALEEGGGPHTVLGYLIFSKCLGKEIMFELKNRLSMQVVLYAGDQFLTGTMPEEWPTLKSDETNTPRVNCHEYNESSQIKEITIGNESFLQGLVPLCDKDQSQGVVAIRMSRMKKMTDTAETTWLLLVVALVCLVAVIPVALIVTRKITRPLRTLATRAASFSGGDWQEIPVDSSDEFGNLAKTLNQMAGTVETQITELQQTKDTLRESEERYRSIYHNTPVMLQSTDDHGVLISVSNYWLEILGYARDEVIGRQFVEFLTEESRDFAEKVLLPDLLANTFCRDAPYVYIKKNGELMDVLLSAIAERDTQRQVTGSLAVLIDITERKRAQEELFKSEENYRKLVDMIPYGVSEIDVFGVILYCNPAYQKITGYYKSQLLDKKMFMMLADDSDREALRNELKRLVEEQPTPYPWTGKNRTRDGRIIDVEVAWEYRRNNQGEVTGFIYLVTDVTERKQAEAQIKASLQEKDVLLKEIHHRVKNNLQIISSLLDMTSMQTSNREAIELLADAKAKVHTMALIHKQLYQSERFDMINMESHVRSLADFLSQAYQATAKAIHVSIIPSTVQLTINQAIPCALVLNELLSNVFKHAFKNRPGGEVEVAINEPSENLIMIRVKDNGAGLPEQLDTQNPVSMGLELVVTLIQAQLHGTIRFEQDGGTEVIMEFPIQKD